MSEPEAAKVKHAMLELGITEFVVVICTRNEAGEPVRRGIMSEPAGPHMDELLRAVVAMFGTGNTDYIR